MSDRPVNTRGEITWYVQKHYFHYSLSPDDNVSMLYSHSQDCGPLDSREILPNTHTPFHYTLWFPTIQILRFSCSCTFVKVVVDYLDGCRLPEVVLRLKRRDEAWWEWRCIALSPARITMVTVEYFCGPLKNVWFVLSTCLGLRGKSHVQLLLLWLDTMVSRTRNTLILSHGAHRQRKKGELCDRVSFRMFTMVFHPINSY